VRASGAEFALGFLLAAGTAVPVGLAAGWYRRLGFVLDPFVAALNATPRIALMPLIVLWVGIGLWSKVAVIFLGAFFPICVSTFSGVRTVSDVHVKVARSFLAGDAHLFRTIVLPSCVPFIVAGLRLGVGRALVGVVVGELYGASAGLGFLIAMAGSTFQTDRVFVGIGVIAAFGIVCNELLARAEARFERWRPQTGAPR
jgi:NitT/TauT family transport system permease protein